MPHSGYWHRKVWTAYLWQQKLFSALTIKRWLAHRLAQYRAAHIASIVAQPARCQQRLLAQLLKTAAHTAFGRDHGFASIRDYDAYRQQVPVRDYEAFRPYIDRVVGGEANLLWPGHPLYLAKTSGTTSGSKYIPISRQSMPNHVKGARDALLLYIHHTRRSAFLDGKMLFLSGSPMLETNAVGLQVGRLSGIANHYVPRYLQRNRVPTFETNCLEDWEAKVAAVVRETRDADLRLISGIPPWVRMFLEEATRQTGKLPAELWPNLNLFVQGGVDYRPYRDVIHATMGRPLDTVEVFPASEGFIAVQDDTTIDALLLMLDYGIFFEFIPLAEHGKPGATRLPLWEVEVGKPYVILLTTNAGLWAYDIGDVVKFVSTSPFRLKVTGRSKHFISAFGEHVIEEEVNKAMQAALAATGATVAEFTVAPLVAPAASGNPSCHEWYVEFVQPPPSPAQFASVLDQTLRTLNTYYDDLRAGGMLAIARVFVLQPNAGRRYMESIGKLGGQNKFPRLTNGRAVAQGLQAYLVTG